MVQRLIGAGLLALGVYLALQADGLVLVFLGLLMLAIGFWLLFRGLGRADLGGGGDADFD